MSIDLQEVLGEVAKRRALLHDMHVATMTVVVYFDDPVIGQWARDRMHALAVKHWSRVIVFDGTQPSAAHQVVVDCPEHQDCVKTRGDWIELGVRESTAQTLLAAVSTLALPQTPVILFWVASGFGQDDRFSTLAASVRTTVYNSSVIDNDDLALNELLAFVRSHENVTIADLAYLRLAPWQESVALFFDARNVIHDLFDLRRVEITCGSDSEAYYLLGWLASRLGWTTCSPEAFCNRFGTQIDFTIVRDGPPRRIRRVALYAPNTEFVAEVDAEATGILLRVTGEHPHPDRFHPIHNIDIASLVERAILTGHNDKVFVESLLAAGEIIKRRRETTDA